MINNYNVIGVMSGTSLDGVDIVYVKFTERDGTWTYELLDFRTIPYNDQMKEMLITAEKKRANGFAILHSDFGRFLGKLIKYFIYTKDLKPDLIASHGHTIFHQPQNRLTVQIGNGAAIAAFCNTPVACNFRTTDVALGGQGAPLVPIGDRYLYQEYDYCLNLGGIANISFEKSSQIKERIAGDIVPCNIILNHLAEKLGMEYDNEGTIARKGNVDTELLLSLNKLKYYSQPFPKSLGKELITEQHIVELVSSKIGIEDKLRTVNEHIAQQISKVILEDKKKNPDYTKMLVTGGGAFNKLLVELLQKQCPVEVVIPDENLVNYKEAIIFGLLGVLRLRGEINCLKSVTGASRDSVGGAIYL